MDFKDIKYKRQLASFLGIEYRILTYVLFSKKSFANYKSFEIPKKNGSTRCINAPLEPLKGIQRKLAKKLIQIQEEHYLNNSIVQGFTRKRSIISNAKNHRNKKFIINMDLENFFESIHFGRVKGYFHKNKHFELPDEIASCLANLVCYNGKLPQGAPSSPVITNLICSIMDRRIAAVAKKYKMTYTRYADDLTFSTNLSSFVDNQTSFFVEISKIVMENGFTLNLRKTRMSLRSSRQEVTGLVVNQKIAVRREFYKLTRAMLDRMFKDKYCKFSMKEIEGRLAFINQIDLYNNRHNGIIKNVNKNNFNAREKQYQLFLFYKYFFHPEKPMIFTEGKTDVIYIKAALKKYCSRYPNLIQRRADGSFEFLVSFLRRNPRLEFFLGICKDGADSMKKVSDLYMTKHSIFSFFKAKNVQPNNPVILLFDNENVEGKPLRVFLRHVKKDLIDGKLSTHVTENLYLAAIPLVNDKSFCEMEDLFDDKVLHHVINGKTFSRKDDEKDNYYGKYIFSQYVLHNYESISFKKFKPLLDSINDIINEFNKKKLISCLEYIKYSQPFER